MHEHQTLIEAARCAMPTGAGWYVIAAAVVSSDGKTRTVTFDGTDPQGHKVHNVVVFEKGM
jgi:hypothetical protein